jgi:hypothetical protein
MVLHHCGEVLGMHCPTVSDVGSRGTRSNRPLAMQPDTSTKSGFLRVVGLMILIMAADY